MPRDAQMSSVFDISPDMAVFLDRDIRQKKYMQPGELSWLDCHLRVARGVFPADRTNEELFYAELESRRASPGGRIMAGAGTSKNVTWYNCLSGDTEVLTNAGYVRLDGSVGKTLQVLSPVSGTYLAADCKSYGVQEFQVVDISYSVQGQVRSGSFKVNATKNHRWILQNGEETTKLLPGMILKAGYQECSENSVEGWVHGFIYGDGTRLLDRKRQGGRADHQFRVRLCGKKAKFLSKFFEAGFEHLNCSYQPSFGGDPTVAVFSNTEFKELPSMADFGPFYVGGFVQGIIDADGSTTHLPLQLFGREHTIRWIKDYLVCAGYAPCGRPFEMSSQPTNFGERSEPLWCIRFRECGDHKGFRVLSVVSGGSSEAFCVEEPLHHQVVLRDGLRTGNCFIAPQLQDSMRTDPSQPGKGIMDALADVAYSMQMGGGVGTGFTPLRPRGAMVYRVNAPASGPLSFMDMWDSMCRTVMSAGERRGAMMATLSCDHPDIEDFIRAKRTPGRLMMFNLSVLVTDAFREAVSKDTAWDLGHWVIPFDQTKLVGQVLKLDPDSGVMRLWYIYRRVRARDLWQLIMESTYKYSEPGVIFIDRVNYWNNLGYLEVIEATNPCFTGDTKVWTSGGQRSFKELAEAGKDVDVLTFLEGRGFVYRTMRRPRVTQRRARLVEVSISCPNGRGPWRTVVVRCTPSHEFHLRSGEVVVAGDLKKGMRLSSVYRRARSKGYLGLYNHSHELMEHHVPFEDIVVDGKEWDVHHADLDKHNNDPGNLELKRHAEHSSDHVSGDKNPMRRFPERNHRRSENGGSAGMKNGRYRHDISTDEICQLRASGLSISNIAAELGCSTSMVNTRLGYERPANHHVKSVRILDEREDVYCGTVDETHTFYVALGSSDGVLVSNCGEQAMGPDDACNLWHNNVARCIKGVPFTDSCSVDVAALSLCTALLVRAGDNLVDLSPMPTEAQRQSAANKRRIGIGLTALGNLFMFLRQRYGSRESCETASLVMRAITHAAYRESIELARVRGPFPLFDRDLYLARPFIQQLPDDIQQGISEHGIRNALLTTIAPVGTMSLAQGDNCSSGLEPVFAARYGRKVLQGDNTLKETWVEDWGFRVYANTLFGGDLDEALKDLPAYMVTMQDLTPMNHLVVQAALQKYVDNSISKTINVPADISFEDFKGVYDLADELECKSCTTYREVPESGRGSILSISASEEPVVSTPILRLRDRPAVLSGETVRVRWGSLPYPIFLTMNDEVLPDGTRHPFEVFINSKSVDYAEWVSATTRLITAVMRKGGDLRFLPAELKAVWSARDGQWVEGKFVPSIVAQIGMEIEQHFIRIGYMEPGEVVAVSDEELKLTGVHYAELGIGRECPQCAALRVHRSEGCDKCLGCGWSSCG